MPKRIAGIINYHPGSSLISCQSILFDILTIMTLLSGATLISSRAFADPTVASASVTVSAACSLTGTNTAHSGDITNGIATSKALVIH